MTKCGIWCYRTFLDQGSHTITTSFSAAKFLMKEIGKEKVVEN
jgi:hypothetical protein